MNLSPLPPSFPIPSCLSLSHEIPFLLMLGHGHLEVFMPTTGMKNWWNYSLFGWKGLSECWTKGLAGPIGGVLTGEALRCVPVARECAWTTGLLLGGHKRRARTISMETPAETSTAFQPLLTFGLHRVFQIRHVLAKQRLGQWEVMRRPDAFFRTDPCFRIGLTREKSVWCSGNIPGFLPFSFFASLCEWVCVTVALVKFWNKENFRLSVGEWRVG